MDELILRDGTVISFEADEGLGDIRAYVDGNGQIGHFSFNVWEINDYEDSFILDQMHIDQQYQKQGIGTQMIKLAYKYFVHVVIPESSGTHHGYHYSIEGAAFLNKMIKKGIIPDEIDSEYDDYDS